MNPKRALLYSIAAGILGTLLIFIYIQSEKTKLEAQRRELIEGGISPGKVQVVVASKDIKNNTRITADMVTTRIIDERYAPPGTVSNPYQIIGCYALRDIEKDQQIFQDDISRGEGSSGSISVLVADPNFRAISLPAEGVAGLSGLLKPGDRVDILATFSNLPNRASKVTTTLCQNVRIIAVGRATTTKDVTSEYDSITVAVTPK
ncbi:MAG: Flp pilus assembly protein CpaB, partial [Elusimicrobiota bacterium]|nr:Flp pilus assembly protein CpaB [Elusimicrobiota bacterium]